MKRTVGISRLGRVQAATADRPLEHLYSLGPDGETIYSFSLWPMLPDETG